MAYLVAKYWFVFLLASALGFVAGRWSLRRLFVDVTDSFETLTRASLAAESAPWDEIRARFDDINGNVRTIVRNEFNANPYPEIPRAFFERIEKSIHGIKAVIADIPEPEKLDLSSFTQELAKINARLSGLSDHADMTNLNESISRLSQEVAAIPAPIEPQTIDLQPLASQVASLRDAIESIPPPIAPETVDLSSIESQLLEVKQTMLGLPTKMAHEPVDLSPLLRQLAALRSDISNLPTPATPADLDISMVTAKIDALESLVSRSAQQTQKSLDPSPMINRLKQLEIIVHDGVESISSLSKNIQPLAQKLTSLEAQLSNIEKTTDGYDFQSLRNRIAGLRTDMKACLRNQNTDSLNVAALNERLAQIKGEIATLTDVQSAKHVDLTPLTQRIETLSEAELSPVAERLARVENLLVTNQHTQLQQLDPLDQRLKQIQTQLAALNKLAPKAIPAAARRPSIGPQLLARAEFGRKDKLQEIAGIGPKLERTLNELGVYYYWQIAAWDKRDIRAVDANLETFKGRIERDDWVTQAKQLRKGVHAAQRPSIRELANKLN